MNRELLIKTITHIGQLEEQIEGEWGECKKLPQMIKDKEMSKVYVELVEELETNYTEEPSNNDDYIVIEDKKYNVTKSEHLFGCNSSVASKERYYKTIKGSYFVIYDKSFCMPLGRIVTEEKIKELLKIYDVQKYEKLFGKLEEA